MKLFTAVMVMIATVLGAHGQTPTCALVSSAAGSYSDNISVTPGSMVTMYATGISTAVFITSDQIPAVLPTTLGGVSAKITDASGSTFPLSLIAVTQNQANAILPIGLAVGVGTVTLKGIGGSMPCTGYGPGNVNINTSSPYLFTSDESGGWLAAAQVILVHANGTIGPPVSVSQYSSSLEWNGVTWSNWVPVPVDLGSSTDVAVLVLYGTGIAAGTTQYAAATALGYATTVQFCPSGANRNCNNTNSLGSNNSIQVPVSYAGAQGAGSDGSFYGLDQINVVMPRSLAGSGMNSVNVLFPDVMTEYKGQPIYGVGPINSVLIDIK